MLGQGSPVRWTAPAGRWTEPDLHLFPQDGHRYEIVDGSLHVTPPAERTHDSLVDKVVHSLRSAAPPGWWVCARLGIEIDTSNLVPDVTVLRPRSSGAIWVDPADVALAVEVESPATLRYDRLLKPAVYASAGIPAYWLVEPGVAVTVYTLDGSAYRQVQRIESAEQVRLDAPYPIKVRLF
ncbi:Uma2 family endonuclease [Actinoplanes regularis]|uniref:Endonuclease, Uma2 family (Restriction endonuclease fold) n=1 Tax=Actinoplanes regularis TaxID=52697 RepID=A0A239B9D7_9ACTN|nr:Uma2 family endonuclease [Actinoplanes regularis]SNS04470.1 Endonuclease, Uma2 family (restriction endonuclease fold) [Actinoplanes regularis]